MNLPATNEISQANRAALPDSWIERIFKKMSVNYGSKFADLWRGTDPVDMKNEWAYKLAGFADMPKEIKEALDALDDKPYPPTLPEFLALCREAGRRIDGHKPAIEYRPTAEEQARADALIKKAAERMTKIDRRDHKEWAKKLKARHESGEILSLIQVNAYREALADEYEPAKELAA